MYICTYTHTYIYIYTHIYTYIKGSLGSLWTLEYSSAFWHASLFSRFFITTWAMGVCALRRQRLLHLAHDTWAPRRGSIWWCVSDLLVSLRKQGVMCHVHDLCHVSCRFQGSVGVISPYVWRMRSDRWVMFANPEMCLHRSMRGMMHQVLVACNCLLVVC